MPNAVNTDWIHPIRFWLSIDGVLSFRAFRIASVHRSGSECSLLGCDWTRLEERARAPLFNGHPEEMGRFRAPTLRNVAKAPGFGFPKAYMHNGVFKSLKEVVQFYNTRDVADWPEPEVPENVNTDELGDLGLTDEEVDAIVAFMETLSDGYLP